MSLFHKKTDQRGVVVLGAPMESESLLEGVNLMPAALRDAGLDAALRAVDIAVADLGDLDIHITDHVRDPATGIIAYRQVCDATETIREGIPQLLDSPDIPLVIGGCCGILVGIFAALRERYQRVGLAFVDGHLDYYDGASAPVGALADMELAILTGRGPRPLTAIVGEPPLVHATDAWILGFRDHSIMRELGAPGRARRAARRALRRRRRRAPERARGGAEASPRGSSPSARAGSGCTSTSTSSRRRRCRPWTTWSPADSTGTSSPTCCGRSSQSDALLGIDVTIYNPSRDPERTPGAAHRADCWRTCCETDVAGLTDRGVRRRPARSSREHPAAQLGVARQARPRRRRPAPTPSRTR